MIKFITSDYGSLATLFLLGLVLQITGQYYLAMASFAAIPIRILILLIKNK